ncbi:response regulator [Roseomonas populi]|uniref:Response regulator n=1 Tax=Roseomonas populi TaxID=3121582 RepID=A0ABT1XD14_9PROT|nr:response regulator [Roseomonas pecuniae]MCR0985323.1 response regulator [Roseomonas pecuniae]
MTTPHILIVDDQDTNRRVYSRLATNVEGARVESVAHPEEALLWLESHEPDLIITDFRMPGLDGAAFTRRVRAMPGCADLPIVVVTVFQDRTFRHAALEAGATDFLLSPVDHVEFRTRVRNLLLMRRQQQQLRRHAQMLEQELAESESSRERLVRDSREALAQVIDTVPAFITATDREGRCVFANAQVARELGTSPSEMVGRGLSALLGSAGRRSDNADRLVLERGISLPAFEEERSDAQGRRRVMLTTKAPLRDAAGQVTSVLTSSLDITDRKFAEERLREIEVRQTFLLYFNDELRPLRQAAQIQAEACRLLGEHLRVARVGLAEMHKQEVRVTVDWNDGRLPSLVGTWENETFASAFGAEIDDAALGAEPETASRSKTLRMADTDSTSAGMRSYLNVPFLKVGQPVALLFIHDTEPQTWTAEQIDLIEEACERLWGAVERAQAAAALHDSQQQLAMALNAARMGTFDWDPVADRVTLTPQSGTLLGLVPACFPATSGELLAILHPEDLARHRLALLEAGRKEGHYRSEYRVIRPQDQRVMWIEERGEATIDPATGRMRVKGVHWDISELRSAEKQQTLSMHETRAGARST